MNPFEISFCPCLERNESHYARPRIYSRMMLSIQQAKIAKFKACSVQVFPEMEGELPDPEAVVQREGIKISQQRREELEDL